MIGLNGSAKHRTAWRSFLAAALVLAPGAATAQDTSGETAPETAGPRIVMPLPDAERGRFLFASKGCVICHSVNGVGGTAGPALDAPQGAVIDPLAFAARTWRGAVAMTALQSVELGYQVDMTGEEIAHLAAFAASPAAQAGFSERDIPEMMQGWTLSEGWGETIGDLPMEEPSREAQ